MNPGKIWRLNVYISLHGNRSRSFYRGKPHPAGEGCTGQSLKIGLFGAVAIFELVTRGAA